jgi:hypothetical protein
MQDNRRSVSIFFYFFFLKNFDGTVKKKTGCDKKKLGRRRALPRLVSWVGAG